MELRESLRGVHVGEVMGRDCPVVDGHSTLQNSICECLPRRPPRKARGLTHAKTMLEPSIPLATATVQDIHWEPAILRLDLRQARIRAGRVS